MAKERELSLINEKPGIHSSTDDAEYADYDRQVKEMKGAGKPIPKENGKNGFENYPGGEYYLHDAQSSRMGVKYHPARDGLTGSNGRDTVRA